jgi:hypothetical protein
MVPLDVIRPALVVLLLFLGGCRLESPSTANRGATESAIEVGLTVDYGGRGDHKSFAASLPAAATVLDLMLELQRRGELDFTYRGRGTQAFLTSLDGIANGGGRDDNWIFRVDGELGRASFGAVELHAGAQVTWTLGKYEPE